MTSHTNLKNDTVFKMSRGWGERELESPTGIQPTTELPGDLRRARSSKQCARRRLSHDLLHVPARHKCSLVVKASIQCMEAHGFDAQREHFVVPRSWHFQYIMFLIFKPNFKIVNTSKFHFDPNVRTPLKRVSPLVESPYVLRGYSNYVYLSFSCNFAPEDSFSFSQEQKERGFFERNRLELQRNLCSHRAFHWETRFVLVSVRSGWIWNLAVLVILKFDLE